MSAAEGPCWDPNLDAIGIPNRLRNISVLGPVCPASKSGGGGVWSNVFSGRNAQKGGIMGQIEDSLA